YESGVDLTREPGIYVVAYRLGQLGGDYSLSREIARRLVKNGDLKRLLRSTQLAGEFQVTYGHLDIIWDGDELAKIIENEGLGERYKRAIGLLRSKESRDYFKRRSAKPTEKWPPDDTAKAE
ncbi:MAG TPA: hypothetical protein VGJ74_16370, partial [Burkholderiales bacterium]